jgi:NAD(P)-dependent dehydrogenase (short-subunit alcohol dehydrogenase family)
MAERVAVVTGASSGLGKEAAKALAAQGWHVIAHGRDAGRSAAAEAEIRAASTTGKVDMIRADLSRMAEVERMAEAIATITDRVDVLINNAGGMARAKAVTPEGLEENFAGNHLGPFLLTNRLLPLIRSAAAAAPRGSVRIVNTSSDGSEMIPGLVWDDLQLMDRFVAGHAYCQAKLANVMHARGLAARLAGDGVVVHVLHPGTYPHARAHPLRNRRRAAGLAGDRGAAGRKQRRILSSVEAGAAQSVRRGRCQCRAVVGGERKAGGFGEGGGGLDSILPSGGLKARLDQRPDRAGPVALAM